MYIGDQPVIIAGPIISNQMGNGIRKNFIPTPKTTGEFRIWIFLRWLRPFGRRSRLRFRFIGGHLEGHIEGLLPHHDRLANQV